MSFTSDSVLGSLSPRSSSGSFSSFGGRGLDDGYDLEVKFGLAEEEVEVLRDLAMSRRRTSTPPPLRHFSSDQVTLGSSTGGEPLSDISWDEEKASFQQSRSATPDHFLDLWMDEESFLDDAFDIENVLEEEKGVDSKPAKEKKSRKRKFGASQGNVPTLSLHVHRYRKKGTPPRPYNKAERAKAIEKFRGRRRKRLQRMLESPRKPKTKKKTSMGNKLKRALQKFHVLTIAKASAKCVEKDAVVVIDGMHFI